MKPEAHSRPEIRFSIVTKFVLVTILFMGLASAALYYASYSFSKDAIVMQHIEDMTYVADSFVDELDPQSTSFEVGDTWKDDLKRMLELYQLDWISIYSPSTSDQTAYVQLVATVDDELTEEEAPSKVLLQDDNNIYYKILHNMYEADADYDSLTDVNQDGSNSVVVFRAIRDEEGSIEDVLLLKNTIYQVDYLVSANAQSTLIAFVCVSIIAIIVLNVFNRNQLLKPIIHMQEETEQFAKQHIIGTPSLDETITSSDELGALAHSISSMEHEVIEHIDKVIHLTAETERVLTELSLAQKIQADMLPNIFPAFPERNEFDLYATMRPAKEVGGDFYNFFMVDDDHLCILIADVSGKGVPAALFMMSSMIIISSQVKLSMLPSDILHISNDIIAATNREDMFVTVWVSILEISTGRMIASNAGHEYPCVMHVDGGFEILKDEHGFVIGGFPGMEYSDYELQLEQGDTVFVYTDGIVEATNADMDPFGSDRLVAKLNEHKSKTPEGIVTSIMNEVDAFAGEAEQFDDLTMLCIRYNKQNRSLGES